MTVAGIVVAAIFMLTSTAAAVVMLLSASRERRRLDDERARGLRLETKAREAHQRNQSQAEEIARLLDENGRLRANLQNAEGLVAHLEGENDWFRAELEKRPNVTCKRYKILTLGITQTGKTSLTLKWANPLVDLGTIRGSKIERYERTVSRVMKKDLTTEHVFEIGDWGGEHLVDAQQELVVDEIHGLLLVVDLANKDGATLDLARVDEQMRAFPPAVLKFFFGPKTIASCKSVVLFINKADVLRGTPAEVEAEARAHYKKLIDELESYRNHVDVRIMVGSASYGHGTHLLFSHFVERILPKHAYDTQLLQRMKADLVPVPMAPARTAAPPLPAPPPLPSRRQVAA